MQNKKQIEGWMQTYQMKIWTIKSSETVASQIFKTLFCVHSVWGNYFLSSTRLRAQVCHDCVVVATSVRTELILFHSILNQ